MTDRSDSRRKHRTASRPAVHAPLRAAAVGGASRTTVHVLEEAIAHALDDVGEGHGVRLAAALLRRGLLLWRGRRGLLRRSFADHAVVGPDQLFLVRELLGRSGHLALAMHGNGVLPAVGQRHRDLGVIEAILLYLLPCPRGPANRVMRLLQLGVVCLLWVGPPRLSMAPFDFEGNCPPDCPRPRSHLEKVLRKAVQIGIADPVGDELGVAITELNVL